MSLHKSLKHKNRLVRRRNVLTRAERIEKLQEGERWDEGRDSVFGLPKVKVAKARTPAAVAAKKAEKEPGEAELDEPAAESAEQQ